MADSTVLVAQVHDPTARLANGGNSGNAGVFSCVEDLAVVCAALLGDGSYNGRRILGPQTVRKMFEVPGTDDPAVARALGWDTYYTGPYTSGDIFELDNVRGHTGYTGTSLILDPDTNTAVIILAHRVHPHDEGATGRLRGVVASIAAASIGR
jgi:CubicO group peptidase (beta-lactamase class C family)